MLPTGDFLAHVGDWTGLPPAELLGLMRGAAPVSAGGSDELERLMAAFAEDAAARELLESDGDPGRGARGAARARRRSRRGGLRLSRPRRLPPARRLRHLRAATRSSCPTRCSGRSGSPRRGEGREAPDVEARIAEVRAQVPEEHRAEFDELLGEARLTYRLRDERGVFSDIWASGLMRRAALAAGRRVADRGRIARPGAHASTPSLDEMCALVAGTGGPSADELAAARRVPRHAHRQGRAAVPRPARRRRRPTRPGCRPASAASCARPASRWARCSAAPRREHEENVLRGLAASSGVYEGPARRVAGPAEFDRIEQGDVLVTESTTEAFNILLPLLGAIVTDSGGLLSHSAIVAREYGIPGVVGTREATERIADGARVRVDGDAGEVTVLG